MKLTAPTPAPPPPIAARSFISVVSATVQPSFDVAEPVRVEDADLVEEHLVEGRAAGHLAQRAHVDALGASCRRRTSVRPLCLGLSGTVRVMISPMSLYCAPEVHTFWPLMTHSSPSRTARVWIPARSEPATGSEKSWQPTMSPR